MLSVGLPMIKLQYTIKCFTLQEVTPPKAVHVSDSIFFENHQPGLHYCCSRLIDENRIEFVLVSENKIKPSGPKEKNVFYLWKTNGKRCACVFFERGT